jgi:hypothetical protein
MRRLPSQPTISRPSAWTAAGGNCSILLIVPLPAQDVLGPLLACHEMQWRVLREAQDEVSTTVADASYNDVDMAVSTGVEQS